jgi:hypothetical protein
MYVRRRRRGLGIGAVAFPPVQDSTSNNVVPETSGQGVQLNDSVDGMAVDPSRMIQDDPAAVKNLLSTTGLLPVIKSIIFLFSS